ncbi:MAG: hypothetical protein U9Q71_01685 [Pseudomonadota bacterium]|nr:hypothetical protein [Pseudomonadota bacterium]
MPTTPDDNSAGNGAEPSPEATRSELARVLQSEAFARSVRLSDFLRFVVEEELAGRGERLNGTRIAIDVFGRDQTFDPRTDPVVRAEAGRLRRALEHYYLTDGSQNPLRIEIPKGAYRPVFEAVSVPDTAGTEPPPPEEEGPCAGMYAPLGGPVIAVLPFRNLGGGANQDYFAEGLTGELITALTRFDILQVIAQQSTARYRDTSIGVRKVGRELGARFVLQGSVQRSEERIRVTAALSDAADGAQLWADTFDRDLTATDLFRLQDELTQSVIARVGDAYGAIPRAMANSYRDQPARELATYEATLRFLTYFNHFRVADFLPAREALEAAVEREPDHGPSWARLSMLCADDYLRGLTPEKGPPERAWELANRAAALAPDANSAHLARALAAFVCRRPEIVITEAERAIELNPHGVAAVGFAGFLIGFAGDFDKGIAILKGVEKLNPFYPSWLLGLTCMAHYMRDEYQQALTQAEQFTQDQWPGKPLYLAVILGQLGKKEPAQAQLELLQEIEPDFAADPKDYIARNFLFDDQIEKIMDGLGKAGL